MPANTSPIYPLTPVLGLSGGTNLGTSRITDYDGTGANNVLFYTAGSNGSRVESIRFKARGTNAVSVARIFINNGSSVGTAGNNTFYGEISLPATTASTTAATVDADYPMGITIPAGYRIYVGISAAADLASGWAVSVVGGDY